MMNRKERRAAHRGRHAVAGQFAAAVAQLVELQRAGRLHEAESLCWRVLAIEPHHSETLHILGAIARDTGRFDAAIAWFDKACKANAKNAGYHRDLAAVYFAVGRLADAATQCRRALALEPDFAEVHNSLGAILMAQDNPAEAGRHFEQALALMPELFDIYSDVLVTFFTVHPAMREAVAAAARAWPARLDLQILLKPIGIGAITANTFLIRLLESHTVCDIDLEKFLTALRFGLLCEAENATDDQEDQALLRLACALARQCFLNEYVFALAPGEAERVGRLKENVVKDLASGRMIPPLRLAVLSSYLPLVALPEADELRRRALPDTLARLVVQQIEEPRAELETREIVPRLTTISDRISASVQRQYEENPYPRWVAPASRRPPESIAAYLQRSFPLASVHGPRGADIEGLIAGCGTGRHAVEVARKFAIGHILAVDLSLSSLSYAIRKTREIGVTNIDYAQADILSLSALGRTFDFIDSSGVLHHLADPFEGWRILLSLLRPDGVMRVGLYSDIGRRDIVAARQFIAGRDYAPTAEDIRRCRQDLIDSPLRAVARFPDFFSVSECRDLLFHVQEHRLTLPVIKDFLADAHAEIIGFELPPRLREPYHRRYPNDSAMVDLDRWHAVEQEHPDTFAGMYQFWISKR